MISTKLLQSKAAYGVNMSDKNWPVSLGFFYMVGMKSLTLNCSKCNLTHGSHLASHVDNKSYSLSAVNGVKPTKDTG